MSMTGERIKGEYQQKVYDIIHTKGCVKRFVIIETGERIKGEYQQKVYDIIHTKGCVKRFVIIEEIAKEYNLPKERAEYIVKYSLKVLTKLGIVKKVGSGFYCVEGGKVE